jgi:hypothetical protein
MKSVPKLLLSVSIQPRLTQFALVALMIAMTAAVHAQSYENAQGRATGRRQSSVGNISRALGQGEDWLTYPTADFTFNTQFQNDYQAFRNGPDSNNLVNTSDFSTIFRFAPRLVIFSDVTYDQINGPNPGEDSWFGQEGLFSSNLFMQYSDQIVTFGGGQYTPDFGIANLLAPGIYGADFVGDYSFDDQLGAFASLDLGMEQVGRHIFSGNLFTVDRSFLSNSAITRQGRTTAADGGPGNTGNLDSFALSYTALDVPIFDMPILQYSFGFISQGAPDGFDTARQRGYVAGTAITIPIDRDALRTTQSKYQAIQPLIEYAHFTNWEGAEDASADYLTLGLEYFYGDWDLNVSTTFRDGPSTPGDNSGDDYLVQATVGYQLYGYQAFGGNGQIAAGWSYRRDGGVYSNTIGIQLALSWDFLNEFQFLKGW